MKHWLLAAALLGATAFAAPPEWVAAKVVKVDAGRHRVTLDHEFIRSIDMAPMVMPFKVDRSVDLKAFQPGDKVRFVVATQDDHLVIQAMEKTK